MKPLTLKGKFIFLWASILLVIAVMGGVANYKASALKAKFEATDRELAKQDLLNRIIAECLQTGQAIRNVYIDPKDKKALDNLGSAIDSLDGMNKNLAETGKDSHEALKAEFGRFFENTKALREQAATGKRFNSEQIIENTNYWREYKAKLKLSIKASSDKTATVKKELEEFIFSSIAQMIIGIAVATVAVSALLFGINRQILRSVNAIRSGLLNFFEFLNDKNVDYKKIHVSGKDEFAQMAELVNHNIEHIKAGLEKDAKMVSSAVTVAHSIKMGDLSKRVQDTPHNPQLLKLKSVLNDMLDETSHNIANILSVLQSYSQNDFTKRVEAKTLEAQMRALVEGVNKLGDEIEDMLGKNLENGLALRHGAEALKGYVESLASASNEQAASLEETSAALEEITSNIASNAEKASMMAKKAKEAKMATQSGEEMATKTVVSMQEIEKATNAINNAVAIIENIAFQTNILSLNAAVEAATAGEAGKGFAVVAQEVRNLAAKSAEAAKTIQALTNEAKNKAKDGTDVSAQMISGFKGIAEKITDTVDLVNDVASANKEQMVGIEQINDAVAQLDQMTQENAKAANNTDGVANQVSEMAENLTNEATQKNFKNKESIISGARRFEYNTQPLRAAKSHSSQKAFATATTHGAKISAIPRKQLAAVENRGYAQESDNWESF